MGILVNDLVIRIKNGYLAKRGSIDGLWSKMNESIVGVLKKERFIKDYRVLDDNGKKYLQIDLLYENKVPVVQDIKLYSKPGRRMYRKNKEVKNVLNGFGIAVYSTPKGIMTNKQAKQDNTGGELLFEIW